MCTAVNDRNLFGRTLDVDRSFGEKVVITPRNYEFDFLYETGINSHFGLIGIACEVDGIPLYFDAINEKGLGMAGLNFPKNAVYHPADSLKRNVASFELIPWVLSGCADVDEAVKLLRNTNVTNDSFSGQYPTTPLHWIVADRNKSVTVESVEEGLRIYDNPFGVLTNNPPFPYHIAHTAEYIHITSSSPKNTLCPRVALNKYGNGFGAIGLPGDYSPASRFVRAVFAKNHAIYENTHCKNINRYFHIMNTVAVPKGLVKTEEEAYTFTSYISCGDRETGTYYFTTYDHSEIRSVKPTSFDGKNLFAFPMN